MSDNPWLKHGKFFDKPPCPFCGSDFGQNDGFKYGCTNDDCSEHPVFHDPIGRDDYVNKFWEEVQGEKTNYE